MATKDNCLAFNKKHGSFVDCTSNDAKKYSNFNLNQASRNSSDTSSLVQFHSKSKINEKFATTKSTDIQVSQSYENGRKSLNNSSIAETRPNIFESFDEEKSKNQQWKKNDSINSSSNIRNSSTLSLHISAYENSTVSFPEEATTTTTDSYDENKMAQMKSSARKQKKNAKQIFNDFMPSVAQSSFEVPRQQGEESSFTNPEVMQFKASQRLLNPSGESSAATGLQGLHSLEPPPKKTKGDGSMENDATCSIIPILNRKAYNSQHILRKSFDQFHLLIAVTGSVATIKIAELVEEFHRKNPENLVIKVIATKSSLNFFDPCLLPVDVYVDEDEWGMWKKRGDPVLHIELRKWADAILIAPMDANTLAKVANGLSDNLLTSVLRAWDFSKYAFFAPAMNTCMWEHPLTGQHLKTLKELLLFKEIPPMEKELMCGDKGYGAMAALQMIVSIVSAEIRNKFAVYSH